MIYNVVLVSGVQQSDSVLHIHISILFQILFYRENLQDIGSPRGRFRKGLLFATLIPTEAKRIFNKSNY